MEDLNCRTRTEDDYISTDGSRNFVNIVNDDPTIEIDDVIKNCTVNIRKSLVSQDKVLNEYSRELLTICKRNNMFIVNGRIGDMPDEVTHVIHEMDIVLLTILLLIQN